MSGRDGDMEVQQGLKRQFVEWHNIDLFSVPPARGGIL